jgi:hypothetical protein
MFSIDPADAPIDWLDNDHVMYVYCRSVSIPRLYKGVTEFVQIITSYGLQVSHNLKEFRRVFS